MCASDSLMLSEVLYLQKQLLLMGEKCFVVSSISWGALISCQLKPWQGLHTCG